MGDTDLAKIYTSTYVVEPGDSLLTISMKYKVQMREIATVNNLFENNVYAN